ncbi:MAG: DUF6398 domain-containing protein [Treponema sp.]|jgi:hypothetical protein|nr:DUF6398 domain-containing protein [Treponema sp.]
MSIPANMKAKYDEIAPIIIKFCDEKLNDDYKGLCLRLLEKLCRKRLSPLLGGRPGTWAAGIVYAIGSNNFIFDNSQEIHMTAGELASAFGISANTAGTKASEIRKMFNISYFNAEWILPEFIEDSPVIWMVMVNGLIVDIRDMPLEIQHQAFEMGLIPYVPGEREARQEMKPKEEKPKRKKANDIEDNTPDLFS